MISEGETVKIAKADEAVAELTIARPESLNALNPDTLVSLLLALEKLQGKNSLRALIVTGEGQKAFVAGADVASMARLGPRAICDYVELGQRAMRAIECFPVPVIAALNGYALGGGMELALACDIIVASESAKLGQPEVNLGIIPGFGGTQRLLQRVGIGMTRRLVYTGELIGAEEAYRVGLIEKIFPPEGLLAGARELASTIAMKAPLAIRGAKKVIRETEETWLLGGLRREVEEFLSLFDSADREEGMNAFLQKRGAVFKGK